jgi:hypothetical protein
MITTLQKEKDLLSKELDGLLGRSFKHTFKRTGRSMVLTRTPAQSPWNDIVMGGIKDIAFPHIDFEAIDLIDRIPTTHGSVSPSGVADLLIVKQ